MSNKKEKCICGTMGGRPSCPIHKDKIVGNPPTSPIRIQDLIDDALQTQRQRICEELEGMREKALKNPMFSVGKLGAEKMDSFNKGYDQVLAEAIKKIKDK